MEPPLQEQPVAWARLRVDVNCGLRRGAWYRIVQVAGNDAVLELTPEPVPVPCRLLETVFHRPFRWSVVPRPRDVHSVPSAWGSRYAVCPVCRTRAPFAGHPVDLRCPRCHGEFAVAWDERYLAPGRDT